MSYNQRNYRHRNPQKGGEQQSSSPFFGASSVQRKKKGGFFEKGTIQRLATSKEDEKIGTNDARMEKDKEEPMKPAVQKCDKGEKEKSEK